MRYPISQSAVVMQLLRHWRQGRTGLTEIIQREELDFKGPQRTFVGQKA